METNSQEIRERYSVAKRKVFRNFLIGIGVSLIPLIYGAETYSPNPKEIEGAFLYPSIFLSDYVPLPEVKRYNLLEKNNSHLGKLVAQISDDYPHQEDMLGKISKIIIDAYRETDAEILHLSQSEPVKSYLITKRNISNASGLSLLFGLIGTASSMFYSFRKMESLDKKRDNELARNSFM